ncbi:hypothetical protein [Bacterioplanoides sp.]|uniref:hypothetical protein n=1 Tax=Bacterioplanoides sp. TaxID=2066072 RepID=UPI003B5C7AFD
MNTAVPLIMVAYVAVATGFKVAAKEALPAWIVISAATAILPLSMLVLSKMLKSSALTGRTWAVATLFPAFMTQMTASWNFLGKSGTETFLISIMVISSLLGSVLLIIEAAKKQKQLWVTAGGGAVLLTLVAVALQIPELLYPVVLATALSPWMLPDRQWKSLPPYLLMLFAYVGIGLEQDVRTYLNLSIVVTIYSIGGWLMSRYITKQIQKAEPESKC